VAPPLGVTHFLILSQTNVGTNLRVIRIPLGPTITFRVKNFSLIKDVTAAQKKKHSPGMEYKFSPLIVLSNFQGNEVHKKLITAMFQNMFPPIDVHSVRLTECRRVVLLHLDKATGDIEFRHYMVKASPHGLSKPIKKNNSRKNPKFGRFGRY